MGIFELPKLQRFLTMALAVGISPLALPLAVQAADPELRRDFRTLAPLMSMDTEIELVDIDAEVIVEKLKTASELATTKFDSDPLLNKVGSEHIHYLIASEARVIPTLRANELEAGQIFAELLSRAFEGQALKAWQRELDKRCRHSYETLLPIVKRLAGPVREAADSEWSCSYGPRSISISSQERYRNCTLAVTFRGISNRHSTAFYFLPNWNRSEKQTLRIPKDFGLTAGDVVAVEVDLFADEATIENLTFELTKNVDRSLAAAIQRLKSTAQRDPAGCIEQLDELRQHPSASKFTTEIQSLRETATKAAKQRLLYLQNQLTRERQALGRMRRPGRITRQQRAYLDKSIKAKQAQIERLNDEIKALRKVR
ncbi:kinetochore Spc7 family protein [Roseimaritima ulvae]|uniref:Uncharacterized protein n=1 Tax=Roseimaritima ulvae TaxID=980254 RepID=A0A5B9QNL7_9BACT|nr:hypothetical protein [Roseimaritima ulvae]QEG38606.1 hypothetical protein UC8_05630 [Roseimaritima ulvae]